MQYTFIVNEYDCVTGSFCSTQRGIKCGEKFLYTFAFMGHNLPPCSSILHEPCELRKWMDLILWSNSYSCMVASH